jgi:hypothetical protein
MSNVVYPTFKRARAMGHAVDLLTADIRILLVDTTVYTYSAADEFLSDVPAGARVGLSPTLLHPAVSLQAVFDADDLVVTDPAAQSVGAIVFVIYDGDADADRRLWMYIDTASGLPYVSVGQHTRIRFNAAGIVRT